MTSWILAVALGSLPSKTSANQASEALCLSQAILPSDRQNVEIGKFFGYWQIGPPSNEQIPLGIWYGDWTSALLSATVYKILVSEIIGYNATFSGGGGSSTYGLYAVAGCKDPFKYATNPDCGSRVSMSHVTMEIWGVAKVATMRQKMKEIEDVIPESLGTLGYDGTDGLFLKGTEKDAAYQNAVSLEYYASYNASWPTQSWKYFDRWTDFDPADLLPCDKTRSINAADMEKYVEITGDEAGVDSSTGKMMGRCWNERWWLAPGCRQNPATCIPVITGGNGWGMFDFQQKATKYDMPLAIAVAASKSLHISLARNFRVLMYAYSPDSKFIDLEPRSIVFPPYRKNLWENGDRTTQSKNTLLSKWVWNQLKVVAPRAHSLASKFSLDIDMMDGMIAKVATGNSVEDVACEWLRVNEALWTKWITDVAECLPGQGVVDRQGAYVTERKVVTGCSWCMPGRFSSAVGEGDGSKAGFELLTCEECPQGRFSQENGAVECKLTPAGMYIAEKGQTQSQPCPVGTYTSEEGKTACTLCNPHAVAETRDGQKIWPLTTAILGAKNHSQCVCKPGSYLHDAACVVCAELQWFECQTTFGIESPMIKPGYMSMPEEPLMIYKCASEDACQENRHPSTPPDLMCSTNHTGVACNRCQSGFSARGEACVSCGAEEGEDDFFNELPIWIDGIWGTFLLLFVCTSAYNESMEDPTAEKLTFGMFLDFVQMVAVIGLFNIDFPIKFEIFFDIGDLQKLIEMVGVRSECFTGTTFTMRLLGRICWPLILQLGFLVVFLLWSTIRCVHGSDSAPRLLPRCFPEQLHLASLEVLGSFWPILSQNLLNCMQQAHLGLFVCILSVSFSLFDCQDHPNGRATISAFMDVECYSDQWWEAFPVAIVGVLVYCVGFASWILYLLWLAPYRVGTDPYFATAYRFIWQRFHPGKWWFTVVELGLAIGLNLIPIFEKNGYKQLFTTALLFSVYMLLVTILRPWKFIHNTIVDANMKLGMAFLVLMLHAFVDVSEEERKETKAAFADLLFALPLTPVVIAGLCALHVVWRNYLAKADSHIAGMLFAQRFRDVMTLACNLSNAEFNKLVTADLCDNDRDDLVQAADVLVSAVLKMQPGVRPLARRIIPGYPYVIGTGENVDMALQKRGIVDLPSVKEWTQLHRVLRSLQSLEGENSGSSKLRSPSKLLRLRTSNFSKVFSFLDTSADGVLERDEFVNGILKRLEEDKYNADKPGAEEIGDVFDMIDIDQSGYVTIDELTAVVTIASKSVKAIDSAKHAERVKAALKIQAAWRRNLSKIRERRNFINGCSIQKSCSNGSEKGKRTKTSGKPAKVAPQPPDVSRRQRRSLEENELHDIATVNDIAV